jgi:Fe(3+) dicitrate transport protein
MHRLTIILIGLLVPALCWAQGGSISGTIFTHKGKQPVPGANIIVKNSKIGTVSKVSGAFALTGLEPGMYKLAVSCVGFQPEIKEVNLDKGEDEVLVVRLKEDIHQLPSMEISGITLTGGHSGKFDLPGAGSYLSPKELETFSNFDINHALKQVPGVYYQEEDGCRLQTEIGLGGSGSERSAKITLMEDGVLAAPAPYAAPSAYYFPTFGRMHAVEILKGSSQIKYGPYTTGGALNLISTPIPASMQGQLNVQGGSYGTRLVHAHAGNSHKNVGYMVETFQYGSEGFKQLPDEGNTGFNKQDYHAKVRVNTNPSAKVYQTLTVRAGWASETSHETYLGLTASDFEANPYQRYAASANDVMNTEHGQLSARYAVQFTKNLETSITAYRNDFHRNWYKLDKVVLNDEPLSISTVLEEPGTYPAALGTLRGDSMGHLLLKANNRTYYSQGVQANVGWVVNSETANHKFHLGLRVHEDAMDRFQHYDEYKMENRQMLKVAAGTPGTESNRVESARAVAGFLQYTLRWKGLTLVPGMRYERITLTKEDYGKHDTDRSGEDLVVNQNHVSALIPGIGFDLALGENWDLFGGVHKGFSPPGAHAQTRPEQSVNYELGGRTGFGALQGQITVWLHDYSNLLGSDLSAAGGSGSTKLFNGGEVLARGIELSATYDLFAKEATKFSMPLSVGYTLTDARFQNDFESDFDPWGNVSAGDRLPYIPPHIATIRAALEHKKLSVHLTGNYQAAMRAEAGQGALTANNSTDARLTLDAAVHYKLNSHFTVYGTAINATNTKYLAARRPAGVRPGTPRLLRAGLMVKF